MTFPALVERYGRPILSSGNRALFYDRAETQTYVFVGSRKGSSYVLNPPVFLAIDAYRNPEIYREAAMRGIENPRRLVPVISLEKVA